MNPLLLLKYLPYAIGVLIIGALLFLLYRQGEKAGEAKITIVLEQERSTWNNERAKAAEEAASASEAYRAKEHDWAASAVKIQQDGEAKHAEVIADADRARKSAWSLRAALDIATKALRSSAASSPSVASNCSAPIAAASLYADMLSSVADRTTEYARTADEAIIAAEACVKSYHSIEVR